MNILAQISMCVLVMSITITLAILSYKHEFTLTIPFAWTNAYFFSTDMHNVKILILSCIIIVLNLKYALYIQISL